MTRTRKEEASHHDQTLLLLKRLSIEGKTSTRRCSTTMALSPWTGTGRPQQSFCHSHKKTYKDMPCIAMQHLRLGIQP